MHAAIAASRVIVEIYQKEVVAIRKEDGSPVTEADLKASRIIAEYLRDTGIPMLGEEQEHPTLSERLLWEENWCIDPLDGTRMFLQRNDEFSVNIAHIVKGKAVFGIIADPVNQKILFGGGNTGVFQASFDAIDAPDRWKKMPLKKRLNNPVTVICSHSYTHGSRYKFMQHLESKFGELHYIYRGSALKFFDLAEGKADIYPRFAPTMEWDIAAGQAILEALGGAVVTVEENKALRYNKEDLFNPMFIAKTNAILKR